MDDVDGAPGFDVAGDSYDCFMGRYSGKLADQFCEVAGVTPGGRAIDVGSGPGALTTALVKRLGSGSVAACDPSPSFRSECAARNPGVVVLPGRAEAIPFESGTVDHAMAQLVLHFVSEPEAAAQEMARVVRPGGIVAACVWDFERGMQMLRAFWDAALSIDPDAPDEARTLRFGRRGEIVDLFAATGLEDIAETTMTVTSTYSSFDELWHGFLLGVGPAGEYCTSRPPDAREQLRNTLFTTVGSPTAGFTLKAVARCAVGRVPR